MISFRIPVTLIWYKISCGLQSDHLTRTLGAWDLRRRHQLLHLCAIDGCLNRDLERYGVRDLEANAIGNYDDTVLNLIDQLMIDAHARGIKLLIGMHDENALQSGDIYCSTYGVDGFYTNPGA
ncbi:hypothetical protein DFH09DRAFT_1308727 [Mycena vulgaris]|nr:hypothetical protein DFH09DRAFT_1308727 [Mycena vulgaris]